MRAQEIVGHNISVCREAKGLTLEALAECCVRGSRTAA